LELRGLIHIAHQTFEGLGIAPLAPTLQGLLEVFCQERLCRMLEGEGFKESEIGAVLAVQGMPHWSALRRRLDAVHAFASMSEAPALAAANKRIANILAKTGDTDAVLVNRNLFVEAAEEALYSAIEVTVPSANSRFEAGDFTAALQTLAALKTPVDAFFEGVMVNADDAALRANRLALLRQLHAAMNRVADLARLAQ
jgi:glycyl-tRNA synthetase beta chain